MALRIDQFAKPKSARPSRLRKLTSRVAPLVTIKRAFAWIASLGIDGYPPDVQRRLKILNMIAALIAVSTLGYAVHQGLTDYEGMQPVVLINLFLVGVALMVPLAHRINEVAGGLILVTAELIALFGFAAFFGRAGGAQIQYMVFAAAPFVVFGLSRFKLVIAIVFCALILHLVAWFTFASPYFSLPINHAVIDSNYTQGTITAFLLIAASVYYAFSLAERAKAETEAVLRNVLPDTIVERLKAAPDQAIADGFPDASILFADISGFVALARSLGPERTVELLNLMVGRFDALAARHGVEKIKTIGDAYMVASGVPEHRPDHTKALARMALDMVSEARVVAKETGLDLKVRLGMASGPIMAGVIGTRKFTYDVWGDAVNLASRLEGLSAPGRILICPRCKAAIEEDFSLESRGAVQVKGVGEQECWFLLGPRNATDDVLLLPPHAAQ